MQIAVIDNAGNFLTNILIYYVYSRIYCSDVFAFISNDHSGSWQEAHLMTENLHVILVNPRDNRLSTAFHAPQWFSIIRIILAAVIDVASLLWVVSEEPLFTSRVTLLNIRFWMQFFEEFKSTLKNYFENLKHAKI